MSRFRARGAIGAVMMGVALLGGLGGCVKYYWSKPSASGEDFNRDSTQCASESSPTTPTLKSGVFVEQLYRSCLNAKGWVRDKQFDPPPPGWYRGIE
jgi:hypothetical protein